MPANQVNTRKEALGEFFVGDRHAQREVVLVGAVFDLFRIAQREIAA